MSADRGSGAGAGVGASTNRSSLAGAMMGASAVRGSCAGAEVCASAESSCRAFDRFFLALRYAALAATRDASVVASSAAAASLAFDCTVRFDSGRVTADRGSGAGAGVGASTNRSSLAGAMMGASAVRGSCAGAEVCASAESSCRAFDRFFLALRYAALAATRDASVVASSAAAASLAFD